MNRNNYHPPVNTENWQQQQFEDAYEDQRHFNRSSIDAQIQAQKELAVYEAKKQINAKYSMQKQEHKRWLKAYEDELLRNHYDEIAVNTDGNITATVQNLYQNPDARIITNAKSPQICRLIHIEQPEVYAYEFTANIGNAQVCIYFDSSNIGNATYLIKKFTARGVIFFANTLAQQKAYARLLICFLLAQELPYVYISEYPGWVNFPDDGFEFISEEELTWKKIINLIK